jgi:hypothetical protein
LSIVSTSCSKRRRDGVAALAGAGVGQRVEFGLRKRDDLSRAHADVHQPLDAAQGLVISATVYWRSPLSSRPGLG